MRAGSSSSSKPSGSGRRIVRGVSHGGCGGRWTGPRGGGPGGRGGSRHERGTARYGFHRYGRAREGGGSSLPPWVGKWVVSVRVALSAPRASAAGSHRGTRTTK